MNSIGITQAKKQLRQLIRRVSEGEEFVITRWGVPVARLVGYVSSEEVWTPDKFRGRIWMRDDFDDPLPPEIMKRFAPDPCES